MIPPARLSCHPGGITACSRGSGAAITPGPRAAIPAGIEAAGIPAGMRLLPDRFRGCSLRSTPGYMLESRWDSHVAPVPVFFPDPDTLSVKSSFSEHWCRVRPKVTVDTSTPTGVVYFSPGLPESNGGYPGIPPARGCNPTGVESSGVVGFRMALPGVGSAKLRQPRAESRKPFGLGKTGAVAPSIRHFGFHEPRAWQSQRIFSLSLSAVT